MKDTNAKIHIIYGIMLGIFVFIILWLAIGSGQPSLTDELYSDAVSFDSGWHTEDGTEINISKLQKLDQAVPYEEFGIYNTLPDSLNGGESLFFRTKNIFYSVYIGGELVYDPYVPESVLYTDSFGTRWSCIELSEENGGDSIEIRIECVYDSARASIDSIYIGSSGGIVLNTIKGRLVAFVTCVLLLFVGVLLIIADIPVNMQPKKNHELMYLELFAVIIAVWCLSETNLIQLFFHDSRLMQVISCTSLMIIPIPLILYLNSAYGFRIKWVVPVLCTLSCLEFPICWTLHLLKIADIHDTLVLSHIMIAVCAVILLYTIIRSSIIDRKKQTMNVYRFLKGVGLCSISVATIIDMIRYYCGIVTDSAMFLRIGLLIFIICYGSSSLENTINAVKRGVQTEFVSRLAYHDGLTEIGNRTAFEEHLADLERIKDETDAVGIVMFDVNDLKYVNDNLGHHFGDSMLVKSAEMIREAFEAQNGECFRIGGDEFAVLLSGSNTAERYKQGTLAFEEGMRRYNEQPDRDFRISIAHGFAVYDRSSSCKKLMDVYQQADKKMYENKRYMKSNQSSPEEYYRDFAPKPAMQNT